MGLATACSVNKNDAPAAEDASTNAEKKRAQQKSAKLEAFSKITTEKLKWKKEKRALKVTIVHMRMGFLGYGLNWNFKVIVNEEACFKTFFRKKITCRSKSNIEKKNTVDEKVLLKKIIL